MHAAPSINQYARAYRCHPWSISHLLRSKPLKLADFDDPNRIFRVLLDHGISSKLRDKLTYPHNRAAISEELKLTTTKTDHVS
jgi:hypothetical protein